MSLSPLAKEIIVREAENRELEKMRIPPPNYKPERSPTPFEKASTIGSLCNLNQIEVKNVS